MKIGIVTIYNSQNCGSFLQAYALYSCLKEQGHNVGIVKNRIYYKNRFAYRFMMFVKYLLKFKSEKAANILKTYFGFRKARKKLIFFHMSEKMDVCVFGSDTIWNIQGEYFDREWEHYFGRTCRTKKVAYAPSIGPTQPKEILKRKDLCDCLCQFNAISVRDGETLEIVKGATHLDHITRVVDPTMLMPVDFYKRIAAPVHEDRYILFYFFGSMDAQMLGSIQAYSRPKGLKLICFGENISGCDKNLIFNPMLMMGYFEKAEYIVTNTFHGNVFSIIFNKPFINIDANKAKINDLLARFELTDRTVKSADEIENKLASPINYERQNQILDECRKESYKFLTDAICFE